MFYKNWHWVLSLELINQYNVFDGAVRLITMGICKRIFLFFVHNKFFKLCLLSKVRVTVPLFLLMGFVLLGISACDQNQSGRGHKVHSKIGDVGADRILNIRDNPNNWLTGGRDYQQSYFSPLNSINKETVGQLGFAWGYEIDTTHGFEATPVVIDGVMFSSGPKGAVYALDAKTGVGG